MSRFGFRTRNQRAEDKTWVWQTLLDFERWGWAVIVMYGAEDKASFLLNLQVSIPRDHVRLVPLHRANQLFCMPRIGSKVLWLHAACRQIQMLLDISTVAGAA